MKIKSYVEKRESAGDNSTVDEVWISPDRLRVLP
jgi:hypothetical protein